MLANETDPELALLGGDSNGDEFDTNGEANHAHITAPMVTGDVCDAMGSTIFPQRAVYGSILDASTGVQVKSRKLYINTNSPFSGIVCGVQGSGKSHSTSVLLESCLISDRRLGTLPEPLSALLFHFDTAAGAGEVPPCEAAYIASLEATLRGNAAPPKVVVLVLPNSLDIMRGVYSTLPEVEVMPLHFAPEDLSGGRILAMMKVEQGQSMPLYMECIMSIIRDMVPFSYDEFRTQLKQQKFSADQQKMLDLRLSILDSCLKGGNAYNRVSMHFEKGQLTIIDLSSPFMDASSACGFFDIILGLFIQAKPVASGRLVVLDEAHKYLTNSGSSSRLTDSLLTVIRQQRHLGTRVLISTQEPTVVPSTFIALCSFVIAHRFSSQKWLDHLKAHISAVNAEWDSKVVNLKTGEAMIFSAEALVLRQVLHDRNASPENVHLEEVAPLGQGYLKVRSRKRITVDGGRSVLAAESPLHTPSVMSSERSISPSLQSVADALRIPSISRILETSPEPAHASNLPGPASSLFGGIFTPRRSRSPGFGTGTIAETRSVSPASPQSPVCPRSPVSPQLPACPHEYIPLAEVMRTFLAGHVARPRRTEVAMAIYKRHPNAVPGRNFKAYISKAVAQGVVAVRENDTLELLIR
ncbi:hypothetical protein JB92DRAFT_3112943 [Gautieria morchelliformis]|nr:hypothetical protein JB92DRAFT_3112943 [Gautieria morchelliformis]